MLLLSMCYVPLLYLIMSLGLTPRPYDLPCVGTGSVEWEWLPILKQSLIQMPVQFSRDPYVVEIPGRMGICMPYVVYPINASRVFVRELFQIPPDLVVKFQTVDIAEVIGALVGRRSSSPGCVATGNQGAICSPQPRPLGLPLNPLECGLYHS